ncbi:hypothetical protein BHE74_00030665 [Ensete ventricosum]|nr:hypothetical protein BHE74_00030665 [Ensete ventricosum]
MHRLVRRHTASSLFSSTTASLEEEEEAEWCNIDADASPLYLLFLLVVDVRINIDKADHPIVVVDHHHNGYS